MGNPMNILRPRILIVDDTLSHLQMLLGLLETEYEVCFATSGEEALELVQGNEQPDLILLDVMMPEMDGYEVCRRLKANPKTSDIPIIFVTSNKGIIDKVKARFVGASGYLTKPFTRAELLKIIFMHSVCVYLCDIYLIDCILIEISFCFAFKFLKNV